MKRAKQFSGILLALCLVLSLFPGTALAAAHLFADVADSAWYSDAVQYVYDNGMMSGTGTNTFSPATDTTRGTIVTILHRLDGELSADGKTFRDVQAGKWYTNAVAWASANGIVTGYDDDTFRPDTAITREQMAAILYRYVSDYKGYAVTPSGDYSSFPDANTVSSYAVNAMKWAVGVGLIQGSDNMLAPKGNATRAQAATIIMRFCENVLPVYRLTTLDGLDVTCQPSGILSLDDGSFLVTDTYNKTVWRVADGASTAYAGGDGATFEMPWAIAPYGDGYAVSDAEAGVVRLIGDGGNVTNLSASFEYPTGLAADEDGNLYVADTFANTVYTVTPEGNVTTYISDLNDPMGLCWKDGTLYIAETGENRIVKTTGGQITLVAGNGENDDLIDGPAAEASFSAPQGVAVGDDGTIYVSDIINGAVRQIKDGEVTTLAQRNANDVASLLPTSPMGLVLRGNSLYVCDNFARAVFVVTVD